MIETIGAALERLPGRVNADDNLRHIGRYCTADFMIEVGSAPFHFSVVDGELGKVLRGPYRMRSWNFAIRGSEDSWKAFWATVPAPGYNDIFAMTAYGHAVLDGDIRPLMKDLRFIKEVLALPRGEV